MNDFDDLSKIKTKSGDPGPQDQEILNRYFDGSSSSFPIVMFSIFVVLVVLVLNPWTCKILSNNFQVGEWVISVVQILAIVGFVGLMVWP